MAQEKNPILAKILNLGFLIEFVALAALLMAKIWMTDDWIWKGIQSDLIVMITSFVLYWLLCYIPKEERDKNKNQT